MVYWDAQAKASALLRPHLPCTTQFNTKSLHLLPSIPATPFLPCLAFDASQDKSTQKLSETFTCLLQHQRIWRCSLNTDFSMERDPFREGGRDTKSQTPSQLCPFPSILLSPSLTTHLTPTPRWTRRVFVSPPLSLACLCCRMV